MSRLNSSIKFELYKKKAIDRIESILTRLDVEFQINGDLIKLKCPVHKSEKITNSTIYLNTGVWICHSDDCNEKYGKTILDLLRGVLDPTKSDWNKVFKFIDSDDHIICPRQASISQSKLVFLNKNEIHPTVSTPSSYYIKRGISPETLYEFEVGDCSSGVYTDKAIIPVQYINGEYMGFTARSYYDECPKCGFYHNPYQTCVRKDDKYSHFKKRWIHKKGTQINKTFYGINKVDHNERKIILVEGISCVWKLYEYGINGIGCFGTNFNKNRAELLKNIGITHLILAMDSDEAGNKFQKKIMKDYNKIFKIYPILLPEKDITEMNDEQIKQYIIRKWELINA